MLRYVLISIAALSISCGQVMAANPAIEEAVKTIGSIGSDPAKLKAYCVALNKYLSAGENEAKLAAADETMNKLLESFGPEFRRVLDIYKATDPDSVEEQSLDAAYSKLDEKCAS